MDGHSLRVSSLSWNSYILSSGSRSGQIIHHDVRQRDHLVATLSSHSHEVNIFMRHFLYYVTTYIHKLLARNFSGIFEMLKHREDGVHLSFNLSRPL